MVCCIHSIRTLPVYSSNVHLYVRMYVQVWYVRTYVCLNVFVLFRFSDPFCLFSVAMSGILTSHVKILYLLLSMHIRTYLCTYVCACVHTYVRMCSVLAKARYHGAAPRCVSDPPR